MTELKLTIPLDGAILRFVIERALHEYVRLHANLREQEVPHEQPTKDQEETQVEETEDIGDCGDRPRAPTRPHDR